MMIDSVPPYIYRSFREHLTYYLYVRELLPPDALHRHGLLLKELRSRNKSRKFGTFLRV